MKITRSMKWGIGVVAVVALLIALVMRPESVVVDVVVVEEGPLSVSIDEDGMTRLRDHAAIAAPVSGRLLAGSLRAGDAVRRGQVVARIAPAPLDERTRTQAEAALAAAGSARAQAESRVRQAEVLLEQAQRDRSRVERLGEAGGLSARAVEDARAAERLRERDLDGARSAVDAAAQGERQARQALLGSGPSGAAGVVEVRSPLTGQVLRVIEEHERVVMAGTPILEVGAPENIEVEVDVLSSDAARIQVGSRMIVRVPDGAELEASVVRVEPAAFTKVSPLGVEEQRVNVIARFATPPVGLGDRFRVATSTVLWSAPSVLSVPSTSLVPADEGWGVYVAEGGRARMRLVELGHRGARSVEILRGLAAGDLVLLHPDERISDGTRVVVR
jgi:HlyD family secretion protein